jgi:hypothetical protein
MAKKERPFRLFTTPPLETKWVYLAQPNDHFENGMYQVVFKLHEEDHAKVIEQLINIEQELLNELAKEVPTARKARMNKQPLLRDELIDDVPTGYLLLKAKSQYAPVVFNANNQKIEPPEVVPNGSILQGHIRLAGYIAGYNYGVTAYLIAVRIIELRHSVGNIDPTSVFGDPLAAADDDADDEMPPF